MKLGKNLYYNYQVSIFELHKIIKVAKMYLRVVLFKSSCHNEHKYVNIN